MLSSGKGEVRSGSPSLQHQFTKTFNDAKQEDIDTNSLTPHNHLKLLFILFKNGTLMSQSNIGRIIL